VLGKTAQRHTSAEFVSFLDQLVASILPGKQIHIIADNLSTHKTKSVDEFLARHPKVTLHYTPTYSSWLNQVELWFSKIQRDLNAAHRSQDRDVCQNRRIKPQRRISKKSSIDAKTCSITLMFEERK
jgi:transposase